MSAQLDLFAAPRPHFAAVSASIASAGGYHCECGVFVQTPIDFKNASIEVGVLERKIHEAEAFRSFVRGEAKAREELLRRRAAAGLPNPPEVL